MREYISASPEETMAFAREMASSLSENAILCLFGELGAGKTTFIKGLASAFQIPEERVNSPTFVYMNIYKGNQTFYHFDLYRIENQEQFIGMGFDEYLFLPGIKCIEWSERIQELLPKNVLKVRCEHKSENSRLIQVEST